MFIDEGGDTWQAVKAMAEKGIAQARDTLERKCQTEQASNHARGEIEAYKAVLALPALLKRRATNTQEQ